jgi:transposase
VEEKRRMVDETLEPGASVARVAQAHGVNPTLLFLWRRQHREGRLTAQEASPVHLLPVTVVDSAVRSESEEAEAAEPGSMHVELPRGRIWIEGQVDAAALRMILEILSR